METSDGDVVAWQIAPTDTRFGRLCGYALVGVLGAFAFLALAAVAIAVAAAVAGGDGGTVFVVVVLVLVGGPFSAVALVPFLDADQRPDDLWSTETFDPGALHPLGVAASVVLAAAGLLATVASDSVLAVYPLVGVLFVASMGLAIGGPSGRVDRDAGTLTVHGNTHPLADLAAVRAVDVGGLVLVNTRFVARPGGRDAPLLFTIPRDAYDQVRAELDAGVAADSTVDATRSRADCIAIVTAGVGSLALAAALVGLGATSSVDGAGVLSFVAAFPALFGVLFLALAARRSA
ncbi:hypothetical protein [Halorubellus salinus]|uniref:hypothetical protein n=1 Tax=Halorubellus salinus TaxID=755309 RepID=UPI001D091EEC|nr:hypothetical protein [Halorubellus salinus]